MNVTATDLVLRCSSTTVGASEVPANSNRGPYVERVLAVVALSPGNPWCAAYVADVGTKALLDRWPLPKTGGCQVLHDWATRNGIVRDIPEPGDVFLVWHPELGRFGHTGFCVREHQHEWTTREGNTSGAGSRDGWIVGERRRRFGARDVFIRWTELVEDL